MKPKRVLIIDDHRDSAVMLAAVLGFRNPELAVDVAHDGETGLPLALAGQHDVVIVDLNLPGVDGAALAVELRRRPGGAPPILIALSGSVVDIARHQTSGVFEHAFAKPVNVDRLIELLGRSPDLRLPGPGPAA